MHHSPQGWRVLPLVAWTRRGLRRVPQLGVTSISETMLRCDQGIAARRANLGETIDSRTPRPKSEAVPQSHCDHGFPMRRPPREAVLVLSSEKRRVSGSALVDAAQVPPEFARPAERVPRALVVGHGVTPTAACRCRSTIFKNVGKALFRKLGGFVILSTKPHNTSRSLPRASGGNRLKHKSLRASCCTDIPIRFSATSPGSWPF
jgi:hypothetical protein